MTPFDPARPRALLTLLLAPTLAYASDAPDLQPLIDAAITQADRRLVIPPGTYRLAPPPGKSIHLHKVNVNTGASAATRVPTTNP